MDGYGYRVRAIRFTVKTSSAVVPAASVSLQEARIPAQGRAVFDLTGTEGLRYAIQSMDRIDAPVWTEVGTVVPSGAGKATFGDPPKR